MGTVGLAAALAVIALATWCGQVLAAALIGTAETAWAHHTRTRVSGTATGPARHRAPTTARSTVPTWVAKPLPLVQRTHRTAHPSAA